MKEMTDMMNDTTMLGGLSLPTAEIIEPPAFSRIRKNGYDWEVVDAWVAHAIDVLAQMETMRSNVDAHLNVLRSASSRDAVQPLNVGVIPSLEEPEFEANKKKGYDPHEVNAWVVEALKQHVDLESDIEMGEREAEVLRKQIGQAPVAPPAPFPQAPMTPPVAIVPPPPPMGMAFEMAPPAPEVMEQHAVEGDVMSVESDADATMPPPPFVAPTGEMLPPPPMGMPAAFAPPVPAPDAPVPAPQGIEADWDVPVAPPAPVMDAPVANENMAIPTPPPFLRPPVVVAAQTSTEESAPHFAEVAPSNSAEPQDPEAARVEARRIVDEAKQRANQIVRDVAERTSQIRAEKEAQIEEELADARDNVARAQETVAAYENLLSESSKRFRAWREWAAEELERAAQEFRSMPDPFASDALPTSPSPEMGPGAISADSDFIEALEVAYTDLDDVNAALESDGDDPWVHVDEEEITAAQEPTHEVDADAHMDEPEDGEDDD